MGVRVGQVGRIESGEEQGRYVRVEDDTAESGGFLILTAADVAMSDDVADSWVESREDVDAFFVESNWVVAWPT